MEGQVARARLRPDDFVSGTSAPIVVASGGHLGSLPQVCLGIKARISDVNLKGDELGALRLDPLGDFRAGLRPDIFLHRRHRGEGAGGPSRSGPIDQERPVPPLLHDPPQGDQSALAAKYSPAGRGISALTFWGWL